MHFSPVFALFGMSECTKIAHRHSLAIFAAGIARNSAVGIIFAHFHRNKNRRSLAIFDRGPLRDGPSDWRVFSLFFLVSLVDLARSKGCLGESEASMCRKSSQ